MEKQEKAGGQMVIVVDDNDNFLGRYSPRHRAHKGEGIHHRAFVCFLINKNGEILLQKRKHWLWDNLWDVSAISHPLHFEDHDESYEEASSRALKKEMDVEKVGLKKIGGFNYFKKHPRDDGCENEYCAIMFGRYDGKVTPDKEDVYEYKWIDFQKFIKDTKQNPKIYTPWAILMVEVLEKDVSVIVLAGGRGTRMGSTLPKVLLKLSGKPLIFWTLDLLRKLGLLEKTVVVTGYKAGLVEKEIKKEGYDVTFARQEKPLGTAHATGVGFKKIDGSCQDVLVLFGDDSSIYKPETIKKFIEFHDGQNSVMTLLTVKKRRITTLGGLKRENGKIVGVLDPETMKKLGIKEHEIVCGAFLFDKKWLKENIKNAPRSEKSGEFVLPGLIGLAALQGKHAVTYPLADPNEWASVNTPYELKLAEKLQDARNGNKKFRRAG